MDDKVAVDECCWSPEGVIVTANFFFENLPCNVQSKVEVFKPTRKLQ